MRSIPLAPTPADLSRVETSDLAELLLRIKAGWEQRVSDRCHERHGCETCAADVLHDEPLFI
jgi:hypothetical protein